MDFSLHIDKISLGLSILYFKGLQVEVSKLLCYEFFKFLANSADLDGMQHYNLGLPCLPKHTFRGFQYTKG